jgi:hypothetical protein
LTIAIGSVVPVDWHLQCTGINGGWSKCEAPIVTDVNSGTGRVGTREIKRVHMQQQSGMESWSMVRTAKTKVYSSY